MRANMQIRQRIAYCGPWLNEQQRLAYLNVCASVLDPGKVYMVPISACPNADDTAVTTETVSLKNNYTLCLKMSLF